MPKSIIIFDIDGTLADITHRLDFIKSKPKNWDAFDAGIPHDKQIFATAELCRSLYSSNRHKIILATGRNIRTKQATEDWLKSVDIPYHDLYMRPKNDFRSDTIVKKNQLEQIMRDYQRKPLMVFDDRPGVVDMWRDNGLWTFDCNQTREQF